jgi:hypothetical protein
MDTNELFPIYIYLIYGVISVWILLIQIWSGFKGQQTSESRFLCTDGLKSSAIY